MQQQFKQELAGHEKLGGPKERRVGMRETMHVHMPKMNHPNASTLSRSSLKSFWHQSHLENLSSLPGAATYVVVIPLSKFKPNGKTNPWKPPLTKWIEPSPKLSCSAMVEPITRILGSYPGYERIARICSRKSLA